MCYCVLISCSGWEVLTGVVVTTLQDTHMVQTMLCIFPTFHVEYRKCCLELQKHKNQGRKSIIRLTAKQWSRYIKTIACLQLQKHKNCVVYTPKQRDCRERNAVCCFCFFHWTMQTRIHKARCPIAGLGDTTHFCFDIAYSLAFLLIFKQHSKGHMGRSCIHIGLST